MAIRAKKSTKTTTRKPVATTQEQTPVVAQPTADTKASTAASFGSPARIRQLAELIQIILNQSLSNGNTNLIGPYTEIKHSLHELADLKEKLETVKSLGL